MDDFDDLWAQSERQYNSYAEELQQIIRVLPTVAQSQREDYQQRGTECLRNIDRALADLTTLIMRICDI